MASVAPAVAEPSPRERRMVKTRRAILDAARSLIDEQGYDHTTIDQIADRADIAPRTFFRYFPSKEALVFAEFDEMRQNLWAILEARPAAEPPLRALVHTLAAYADLIEANHERLAWGFRVADDHPQLNYEVSALKAESINQLTGFIAGRLGVDPAEDPRPAGWAVAMMGLFGATMSTVFHVDARPGRSPRATFLELVAETGGAFKAAVPR
jgi:AcrR family transcriptional regulator